VDKNAACKLKLFAINSEMSMKSVVIAALDKFLKEEVLSDSNRAVGMFSDGKRASGGTGRVSERLQDDTSDEKKLVCPNDECHWRE
jgi:hypothetical protein